MITLRHAQNCLNMAYHLYGEGWTPSFFDDINFLVYDIKMHKDEGYGRYRFQIPYQLLEELCSGVKGIKEFVDKTIICAYR